MKPTILLVTTLFASSLLIGCNSIPTSSDTATSATDINKKRGKAVAQMSEAQRKQYDAQRAQEAAERKHQREERRDGTEEWNGNMKKVIDIQNIFGKRRY